MSKVFGTSLSCAARFLSKFSSSSLRSGSAATTLSFPMNSHGLISTNVQYPDVYTNAIRLFSRNALVSVVLPSLSPSMTHGRIVRWYVREGQKVAANDLIFDVETDELTDEDVTKKALKKPHTKVTLQIETADDGIVEKIIHLTGKSLPVGTEVALLRTESSNVQAVNAETSTASATASTSASASANSTQTESGAESDEKKGQWIWQGYMKEEKVIPGKSNAQGQPRPVRH